MSTAMRVLLPTVSILLLTVSILSACGGAGGAGTAGPHAASPPASGYTVTVRHDGHAAGHFDLAALRALHAVDVATPQSHGKLTQRGPQVRAVLARAGVKRFSSLRAVGRDGARTFSSAEIDDQVVLDFDNRGTVKLAGANLAQDRWVREVTELDAQS